jgi:hypothetical protein
VQKQNQQQKQKQKQKQRQNYHVYAVPVDCPHALRVDACQRVHVDAERQSSRYHAERGSDQVTKSLNSWFGPTSAGPFTQVAFCGVRAIAVEDQVQRRVRVWQLLLF